MDKESYISPSECVRYTAHTGEDKTLQRIDISLLCPAPLDDFKELIQMLTQLMAIQGHVDQED